MADENGAAKKSGWPFEKLITARRESAAAPFLPSRPSSPSMPRRSERVIAATFGVITSAMTAENGVSHEEKMVENAVKRVIDSADVFRELGVGRGDDRGMASNALSKVDKCVSTKCVRH